MMEKLDERLMLTGGLEAVGPAYESESDAVTVETETADLVENRVDDVVIYTPEDFDEPATRTLTPDSDGSPDAHMKDLTSELQDLQNQLPADQ